MTVKNALPGLVVGALALVAGVVGFVADIPFAGVVAGLFGLAGAGVCVRLASRLEDEALLRSRLETAESDADELRAAENTMADLLTAEATGEAADADLAALDEHVELSIDVEVHESDDEDEADEDDHAAAVLVDHTTGLFSESFFQVALETRIAAARRHLRPVAVVLIEVVTGLPTEEPVTIDALIVADTLKETLREADVACRLRNGYFALLLEDTPENGAIWTVERIRRQLVATQEGVTVWAGIACYPAHAFSPDGIIDAAEQALVSAREWRQDRIEVAASAE